MYAEFTLHRDVFLQPLGLVRMHDADESSLAEIAGFPNHFAPMLKHLQTDHRQLHFWWVTVVHANQRGRTAAAPAPNMLFFNHRDLASATACELEGDRGPHHAGAQNDDVRDFWKIGVATAHAAASLKRFFFQSRRTCFAALCPGAPVTPPPGCAPAPHRYRPLIGLRYCDHPGTGRRKNNCSSRKSP